MNLTVEPNHHRRLQDTVIFAERIDGPCHSLDRLCSSIKRHHFDNYFSKIICAEETYCFSAVVVSRLKKDFSSSKQSEERAMVYNCHHCQVSHLAQESASCLFALCMSCCTAWVHGHAEYAGVRPVVSVSALAVVWRCVGLARWQ